MVSTRNQEPTFDSSINAQNKSVRILKKKKVRVLVFGIFFLAKCCPKGDCAAVTVVVVVVNRNVCRDQARPT